MQNNRKDVSNENGGGFLDGKLNKCCVCGETKLCRIFEVGQFGGGSPEVSNEYPICSETCDRKHSLEQRSINSTFKQSD